MKTLKDFWSVLDWQTLIVTLLAVASTLICHQTGFLADIPTGLIGLAVVFPIVFSINAAYKRREDALKNYSGMKAHAVTLYYAHRDWLPGENNAESDHCRRVRKNIADLFTAVKEDLMKGGQDKALFARVYGVFSRFSRSNEVLRAANLPANEVSRCNQYIEKMIVDYEKMRNIAAYRTPVSLRAYSRVFLNFFPIAFGPYFAMLVSKSTSFPAIGYIVAVLYSLVLVTLDNIQEDLENPFDAVGTDDIQLDIDEYEPVLSQEPLVY